MIRLMARAVEERWGKDARFFWKAFGVVALLHALAVIFSEGFQAADEHFQIFEFLAFKLGWAEINHLSVEYHERMRPFIQPALAWVVTRFWLALGVEDRFFLAAQLRGLASLWGGLSLFAMGLLIPQFLQTVRARRTALLSLAGLWFIPALHARFSSESMSGSSLVLALTAYLLSVKHFESARLKQAPFNHLALLGIFLGLAFEFRFQMGLAIAGFLLWLLLVEKRRFFDFFAIFIGFLSIFLLGRLCDRWGYGEWVFSPYHYLRYNLLENKISQFGVHPWWGYFSMSIVEAWPLLATGLLVWVCLSFLMLRQSILTWTYAPFMLFHFLLGHKEWRFLFPVASAAPLFFGEFLDFYEGLFSRLSSRVRSLLRKASAFLKWNNGLALFVLTLAPASSIVSFYRAVDRWIPELRDPKREGSKLLTEGRPTKEVLLHSLSGNPFQHLGSPLMFYQPASLRVMEYADWAALEKQLFSPGVAASSAATVSWVFDSRFNLPEEALILRSRCERVYQTVPHDGVAWLESRQKVWKLPGTVRVWTLYRCRN
jgi:phosphatidylinositol glycan class B